MKMYLISDNIDTEKGLRLAGVKGVVAHEYEEIVAAFKAAMEDREIGLIVVTEKIDELAGDYLRQLKLERTFPLITVIPDRHGRNKDKDNITSYIREAIGLRID